MKFGIQLYNFRRFLAEDFEGTMQKISQLGFEGAEVVVYRGPLTPAEYAASDRCAFPSMPTQHHRHPGSCPAPQEELPPATRSFHFPL